jgi:hypothetical protein
MFFLQESYGAVRVSVVWQGVIEEAVAKNQS